MTVLPVTELDIVLAVGLLLVAGLALFLPRRDTAVVMFLVFGVLLAVSWARLNAPDVALAEAAIGAGVTSALLMDAVTYRSPTPTSRSRAGHLLAVLAAGFAGAMAVGLAVVLLQAGAPISPPAGPPHGVAGHLDSAGVSHPVTAVLLNFRSYDTLLEIAVLLVAVLAALAIQPGAGPGAVPAPTATPDLLGLLVRILGLVVIVVAGWLLIAGSTVPGGAFQAGAVLAGGLLLMRLSGWPEAVPTARLLRTMLLIGLTGFLALAYLSAAFGAGWLHLDPAWAGQAILALDTLLALSIGMTVAAIFVANQDPTATGGGPVDVRLPDGGEPR
jgi:multisubunit Na+/H+ antiporter MnhB subunit